MPNQNDPKTIIENQQDMQTLPVNLQLTGETSSVRIIEDEIKRLKHLYPGEYELNELKFSGLDHLTCSVTTRLSKEQVLTQKLKAYEDLTNIIKAGMPRVGDPMPTEMVEALRAILPGSVGR